MSWKLLDTGVNSAVENMAKDARLLASLAHMEVPLLHLYDWTCPSMTYGHFIDPALHINLEEAKKRGIELAKRPTGGGIIFHTGDLAFSVLLPSSHPSFSINPQENYACINQKVLQAIEIATEKTVKTSLLDPSVKADSCGFCQAGPTIYDVIVQGKKVAGSAIRLQKQGLLYQGSICITLPDLKGLVKEDVEKSVQEKSFPLFPSISDMELKNARLKLKRALAKVFAAEL